MFKKCVKCNKKTLDCLSKNNLEMEALVALFGLRHLLTRKMKPLDVCNCSAARPLMQTRVSGKCTREQCVSTMSCHLNAKIRLHLSTQQLKWTQVSRCVCTIQDVSSSLDDLHVNGNSCTLFDFIPVACIVNHLNVRLHLSTPLL